MNTTPDINNSDASPSAGIPADNTPQGEQPAKDSHGKQENGSRVERSLRQATMDNQIQLGYLKLKVMKSQADTKEEENKKLGERVAKMDERICQLEARMDTATPGEREAMANLDELSSRYLKRRRMI